ncbi:hypothetical protein ACYSNR_00920 [Enterococcus sp. LJL128]
MKEIIEQLKGYCDCLPDAETEQLEKNITELINLVSMMTCWTQEACETFLAEERKEIFTVEDVKRCGCEGGIFKFTPFFTQIFAESFELTLIRRFGIKEELFPIGADEYLYSEFSDELRVDLSKYLGNDLCNCQYEYMLIVEYIAGYQELPECLLPIFCDMLHIITSKNECDCSKCQTCNDSSSSEGYISTDDYNGNLDPTAYLERVFMRLIESAYKNQLGLISLCNRKMLNWWGEVI